LKRKGSIVKYNNDERFLVVYVNREFVGFVSVDALKKLLNGEYKGVSIQGGEE